ncbi:AAA family ATPase [Mycobacterium intracellulare]|uniref:AAA family ATPase n=1 Tax=Mycobacterium intracellulare TaxID=1767 RepID=UPI000ABB861C|nr:AAA family ATPase [Mycobacterium intracellulare]
MGALLAATTTAGVKCVLVGDAHQLAPVKARGGMFAQLCEDLPWTQKLSEVWRMRDPDERSASLAVRDGGPAPVRRAAAWYRAHGRLRTGDPIAMAADALAAYRADTAAGKDALLICDTKEMADALNRRIHDESIDAQAPTVTAARGHRIAKGDVIISRRNDPAIPGRRGHRHHHTRRRSGAQRATLARLGCRPGEAPHRRPPARRRRAHRVLRGLPTPARHPRLCGHRALGPRVTAETTHAVLGETTTRSLLYVALTRGRHTNHAYLYERLAGETEHEHADQQPGVHVARRGTSAEAAQLVRGIIANRDERARTAHDIAAHTQDRARLPKRVQRLLDRRDRAVQQRWAAYRNWHGQRVEQALEHQHWLDQHRSRSQYQSLDSGLEL